MTPPAMKFTISSDVANQSVYEGMVLDLHVSPLFGIPMKWQSTITQVDPYRSFTDLQTKGPYRLWRHHHEYIANQAGVFVLDNVEYQLPFGILGNLAHRLVRKKLEKLFDYRYETLERLFGVNDL
jgi:ligand-binding SRPBCC domain-containing protein